MTAKSNIVISSVGFVLAALITGYYITYLADDIATKVGYLTALFVPVLFCGIAGFVTIYLGVGKRHIGIASLPGIGSLAVVGWLILVMGMEH